MKENKYIFIILLRGY